MFWESEVSEYITIEKSMLANVDQVEPPLVNLSILYPVIGEPPLFVGADQDRLICDGEDVVAIRFVGDCDAVIWIAVVVEAIFDDELIPITLIADIL